MKLVPVPLVIGFCPGICLERRGEVTKVQIGVGGTVHIRSKDPVNTRLGLCHFASLFRSRRTIIVLTCIQSPLLTVEC